MSSDENMEDPLADLEASINGLGLCPTDPMVSVMSQFSKKISSLSVAQSSILVQNKLLIASERKSKVDLAVGKLANPISIRSVKTDFRIMHLVQDLLEVFKPNDVPL